DPRRTPVAIEGNTDHQPTAWDREARRLLQMGVNLEPVPRITLNPIRLPEDVPGWLRAWWGFGNMRVGFADVAIVGQKIVLDVVVRDAGVVVVPVLWRGQRSRAKGEASTPITAEDFVCRAMLAVEVEFECAA